MSLIKIISLLLISYKYIVDITSYIFTTLCHVKGSRGKSNKTLRINSITYIYIKSISLGF